MMWRLHISVFVPTAISFLPRLSSLPQQKASSRAFSTLIRVSTCIFFLMFALVCWLIPFTYCLLDQRPSLDAIEQDPFFFSPHPPTSIPLSALHTGPWPDNVPREAPSSSSSASASTSAFAAAAPQAAPAAARGTACVGRGADVNELDEMAVIPPYVAAVHLHHRASSMPDIPPPPPPKRQAVAGKCQVVASCPSAAPPTAAGSMFASLPTATSVPYAACAPAPAAAPVQAGLTSASMSFDSDTKENQPASEQPHPHLQAQPISKNMQFTTLAPALCAPPASFPSSLPVSVAAAPSFPCPDIVGAMTSSMSSSTSSSGSSSSSESSAGVAMHAVESGPLRPQGSVFLECSFSFHNPLCLIFPLSFWFWPLSPIFCCGWTFGAAFRWWLWKQSARFCRGWRTCLLSSARGCSLKMNAPWLVSGELADPPL